MKKRVIGILLAMVMVLLCMSACGTKTANKNDDGADDESVNYELLWYFPGKFGSDQDMVNDKVNEYLKDKLNITLKLMPLEWGVYSGRIKNILSTGEKADLVWSDANSYFTYVDESVPIDITEMIHEYAPETEKMLGEEFLEGCKISDKLYGIPANKDKAHSSAMIYRKDIADKYNFDIESANTVEDWFKFYDVILQNEPNMVPYGIDSGGAISQLMGNSTYQVGATSSVVFTDAEPDKAICATFTQGYEDGCRMAKRMYDAGYVSPDIAVKEDLTELKASGRVFSWASAGHPQKLEELQQTSDYPLGSKEMTKPVLDSRDSLGSIQFIPFSCENPVRVLKFVELFNTDPYLNNLINFGIEGVHFEKTGENTIKTTDRIENYNFVGSQWELGNTYINYVLDGYNPNRFELMDEYNKSAYVPKCYGFMFDMEEVAAELTACRSVDSEYWKGLAYGTVDIDTVLPEYREKLKRAGIDEVLAAAQRQYDEWLAKKENK